MCLGIGFYLAESRERAIKEITPLYEEHAKMFCPLHFLPMSDPQKSGRVETRWMDVRRCADSRALHGPGIVVRRHIGELGEFLKRLEERFPGLEHVGLNMPMATPNRKWWRRFTKSGRRSFPNFDRRTAAATRFGGPVRFEHASRIGSQCCTS